MAKRRGGTIAVCPQHPGSHVVCHERRVTKSGVREVFRCRPDVGRPHRFSVALAGDTPVPTWSPPPGCPEHPAGRVVRDGHYGKSTASPRQRYRCYPDIESVKNFHRFTPWLPRQHVHVGKERCDDCEEFRGTHRGDQTISRRQSWSARLVAESLRDLARGGTYSDVSRNARAVTARRRTRVGSPAVTPGSARERKNSWHIAADWVEAFGPILWDHVDARLRSKAADAVALRDERRLAGEHNPMPVTVVIDDVPIKAKWFDPETKKNSQRQVFAVLVVAEVNWIPGDADALDRVTKLRLVRGYPTNDRLAWKLVLDELGYVPDFIVSDASAAQMRAIREHYANEECPPTVIPSLFHVRATVEDKLRKKTPGATTTHGTEGGAKELLPELADHLALLSRQRMTAMDVADWSQWWDTLEAHLTRVGAPLEPVRLTRENYEQLVADVLPTLAAFPQLPLSTGGVEVAMRRKLDPLLANRAQSFANLERTNRLFDLAVCDDHGLFTRMPEVINMLRRDSAANNGWGSPLRMVADPQPPGATAWKGRYSSLRDQLLLRELAEARLAK